MHKIRRVLCFSIVPIPLIFIISLYSIYFSKIKTIIGSIIRIDEQSIEIITPNDSLYTIPYSDNEYLIGDNIKIKYIGKNK